MGFTPPNVGLRGNAGHSSAPVANPAGRGATPTGDRFRLPEPPADGFPPAAIAPGKGAVPVEPPTTGMDVLAGVIPGVILRGR